MPADFVVVSTTLDQASSAHELAESLVGAGLVACAQINGPIRSIYRWEGEVRSDEEWRLDLKTTQAQATSTVAFVEANHPYEVPEVIVVPIQAGSPAYLNWISSQTS